MMYPLIRCGVAWGSIRCSSECGCPYTCVSRGHKGCRLLKKAPRLCFRTPQRKALHKGTGISDCTHGHAYKHALSPYIHCNWRRKRLGMELRGGGGVNHADSERRSLLASSVSFLRGLMFLPPPCSNATAVQFLSILHSPVLAKCS